VHIRSDLSEPDTCIKLSQDDRTLDCHGYTILGDVFGTDFGIDISGTVSNPVEDVIIQDCVIKDFFNGIRLSNAHNIKLNNNKITNNMEHGISLTRSSYCSIVNNEVSDNGENGVNLHHSSYNLISDIDAFGNNEDGIFIGGVELYNKNNTIDSGVSSNNHGNGAYIEGIFNAVKNSTIQDNNNGVLLHLSNDAQLIDNTINSNTETGVLFYDSPENSMLVRNIICDNGLMDLNDTQSLNTNQGSDNTCSSSKVDNWNDIGSAVGCTNEC